MKQDAPPMQSSEDEREQNALTKAIHDEELSEARKAQEKYRDLSLEGRQSALPTLFLSCRPKKSKRKTTGLKKKETNILERKSRLFGSKSGYKTTGCPLKGGIDNSKTAAQKCNVRSENDESALHELKAASAAKALEDNKNDFGCNHSFLNHDEIDSFVGKLWRTLLMYILLISFDVMNALRLTRPLQLSLPFLTAHEAYLVAQVIEAFDTGKQEEIRYALSLAFMNRNVSRLLLQNIRLRYDFLWHWHTMITWNRLFDGWGQFPIIGITSFPPTENFPSTRNHALASIFRLVLGPGNWPTRVFTGGREGLLTDTPENVAQNLAAESNGFEFANRNQYGTYIGRRKLNEFRKAHRLPTDESIVRTFVAQPTSTMLNNGVFHTIRQLANHWHNTLNEPCGNFSHQRMEQLDPFETLRFHMPEVLLVLSSLRGRNSWDAMVLGPMVKKLQSLSPSATTESAKQVVRELQTTIVVPVCAGIPSLVNPFRRWLDAIHKACVLIDKEAQKIFKLVSACRPGIRVGYNLVSRVNWRLPSDQNLKKMILDYIDGKSLPKRTKLRVQSALQLTTPRDKRTLIELAQKNLSETKSAKLLIGRVKTLLQREYRRELLNKAIRQMSKGKAVVHFLDGEWYWLEGQGSASTVFAYDKEGGTSEYHRFVQLSSGKEKLISKFDETIQFRQYIAVGECISRAQKVFMTIELEYGKHFTYGAFMEFTFLRSLLRQLAVISQITCEELDKARVNVMQEIQQASQGQTSVESLILRSCKPSPCDGVASTDFDGGRSERKRVTLSPQNMMIIGGGPAGLIMAIHCAENVLLSGGIVKLFEARNSLFERSQIVRLDARWIAMMRYHLGTGFEDVFIPASGETDASLGNTLPTQGFVEITIKDLEAMLHTEVSRLWSAGIISVFADAMAKFDSETNSITKYGKHLKVNDIILRNVDENGNPSKSQYSWKVVSLLYAQSLGLDSLKVGEDYSIYMKEEDSLRAFKLTFFCLGTKTYHFMSLEDGVNDLKVDACTLPSIYSKHITRHAGIQSVVLESVKGGENGVKLLDELFMNDIENEKFILDVGQCHVIEAIGKPRDSEVHFRVTTPEPYGVCCLSGTKVSMGMHNFGEKRWGAGLLDDFRSQNDQNTRIIGDFTKMVRLAPIAERMYAFIARDENWRRHFRSLLAQSPIINAKEIDSAILKLEKACKWHANNAKYCRRQSLQTRFFETGDNFYLGMELPREYQKWKTKLVDHLLSQPILDSVENDALRVAIQHTLQHHIDRLFYECTLDTIRTGDVYNPGARSRVPRLYVIDGYADTAISGLPVGESFRLSGRSDGQRYEVLIKRLMTTIVRNQDGRLTLGLKPSTLVRREGDLTRTSDGITESKVALTAFDVCHYVNHRTMRLNERNHPQSPGYVTTFAGDEQATPHFMRYSGLTGACVNAMLFNNFIKQAIDGIPLVDRYASFSRQTHWSNAEVVHRGTGSNFGMDGFLRPGFSYDCLVDYLYARIKEHQESRQNLTQILTFVWKEKIAASLIPKGMELNKDFLLTLRLMLRFCIFNRIFGQVKPNWKIGRDSLNLILQEARKNSKVRLDDMMNWEGVLNEMKVDQDMKRAIRANHISMAKYLEIACNQIIDHASRGYLYNERIATELSNQPKPVGSILDDFAVEAQNFANSLVMAVAFSSVALAFRLVGSDIANTLSAVVSFVNIISSFGTMTNVARYKIRNEEARIIFFNEKLLNTKKAIFSLLDPQTRSSIPTQQNPFVSEIETRIQHFQESVRYYDYKESSTKTLRYAAKRLQDRFDDPKEIRKLQFLISSTLIPDTFHVNSYLQEELVELFRCLEEMLFLMKQRRDRKVTNANVKAVFDHLEDFTLTLEDSLQRGPIRFGFIKQRRFVHWDIFVVLRYLISLASHCFDVKKSSWTPIEKQTYDTLRKVKRLSSIQRDSITLKRETRDLEELYWATHESDIASMIFVSASFVFTASLVFTIARVFAIDRLERVAFWATAPSASGAFLAAFHFVRKLRILGQLWLTLGHKVRKTKISEDRNNIQKARSITFSQIVLTMLRLMAAVAATIALPWSIAENGYGEKIGTLERLPFYIALAAVIAAILATIFFFVVEYVIRYNLSPRLPKIIVESFRDEVNGLYWTFRRPWNDIETKQVQERVTWEYVAREFLHKYRFDTVFAADRFGSILQYLQSGTEEVESALDYYDKDPSEST